jgi:Fe2+ transport protein
LPESTHLNRAARRLASALALVALLAGCASANKTVTAAAAGSAASSTGGMNMSGGSASSSAASMNMSGGGMTVNGIKAIPTQTLASATWQGMRITARAMTAVPFVIYNGTTEKMVKPGPNTSFHLMVMLNDSQTGVPIPYASVWATIRKAGKIVYDEEQWPMISRYMGPHYGNDVHVPGAGTYQLSLLVSPPVSARHVEYQNVWLKPHRVNFTFHWKPLS